MRRLSFIVLLATVIGALSAQAQTDTVETCATDASLACALEIRLPGFWLAEANPIVIDGKALKLLGSGGGGQMMVLDVALADGAVIGRLLLDETPDQPVFAGLIASDGRAFAVYMSDGNDDGGLQFYDASGRALGLLSPDIPEGWDYELSPAATMMRLASQNLLSFDDHALSGTFYRFELSASVSDGVFQVRELTPASNGSDTLGRYLERRFAGQEPGPGYAYETFQGLLSAVTTEDGDGSPSRFTVRSVEGGEIAFDQRLGKARMGYFYRNARLSPDGARVAVIRGSSDASVGLPVQLMVFDVATTFPVFVATLPEGAQHRQVVWLPDNRIGVLQSEDKDGTDGFVFVLPLTR